MKNFEFHSPTRIVFGKDSHARVGELLKEYGVGKVLVLYGQSSAIKTGLLGQVRMLLEKAGIEYAEMGGIKPNPVLSAIRRGISLCTEEKAGFILAVGGGSVIDSAKAIALGLQNPGRDVWDFFTRKALPSSSPAARTGIGCILTIAAAGSEAGGGMVIVNDEDGSNQKRSCNSKTVYPVFSILNPAFISTVPSYYVSCAVADIMMHTMERFFSPVTGNRLTDRIALALLRTVMQNGKKLVEGPDDYDAASEVMWASTLSHNGLTGLGGIPDFSTHQLGHELSGHYGQIHGATLTAMWGSWARYVMDSGISRFAEFGRELWPDLCENLDDRDAAEKGICLMEEFFRSINMPLSIPELMGRMLDEQEIAYLAEQCSISRNAEEKVIGSFKVLGCRDILEIYAGANRPDRRKS